MQRTPVMSLEADPCGRSCPRAPETARRMAPQDGWKTPPRWSRAGCAPATAPVPCARALTDPSPAEREFTSPPPRSPGSRDTPHIRPGWGRTSGTPAISNQDRDRRLVVLLLWHSQKSSKRCLGSRASLEISPNWPMRANYWPLLAMSGPTLAQFWPHFAPLWPNFDCRPDMADVGQVLADVDQALAKFNQPRPHVGQMWPRCGHIW